jgi:tetratricopeptide (TPR) repeat protein
LIYPLWRMDSSIWWNYLFPLGAFSLLMTAWILRRRIRWFFASLVLFLLLIAPFLGFFNVGFFRFSFVADHFQYLPSLGAILPAAAGSTLILRRLQSWERLTGYLLCVVLLAMLAKFSWQQAHAYRDADACYRSVIEKNPTSWEAHMNIGADLFKKGSLDEAMFHFRKVLEVRPDYPMAAKRAYISLGNSFLKRGQWSDAITNIEQALELDPKYAPAHAALGSALHRIGKLRESIDHYEIALRLRPQLTSIQSNLAWMLATCANPSLRDGRRALSLAHQANEITGGANPRVLRSLAAAYAENGRFFEASRSARQALELTLHDQGHTLFSQALVDEIARYERAEPYHEVANAAFDS